MFERVPVPVAPNVPATGARSINTITLQDIKITLLLYIHRVIKMMRRKKKMKSSNRYIKTVV